MALAGALGLEIYVVTLSRWCHHSTAVYHRAVRSQHVCWVCLTVLLWSWPFTWKWPI